LLGTISGIVVFAIAMYALMPKMMITIHQSQYDSVEETCKQLQAAVEANGWSSPPVRSLNEAMAKMGVVMERRVSLVELCKATYAKDILTTNPEVSTLMPCAWGVYEGDDGKIYISGMNMGLMGRMFGGNIAKIMGGYVSADEKNMLKDVIK